MESQHVAVIWAEPQASDGMRFKLKALILGGPDDTPELWCQGLDWGHGNGVHSGVTGECLPYQEGRSIPRDFEQTVTYDTPGTYQATFEHGSLSATTTIVAPWTP
jgi:hypothetical protein